LASATAWLESIAPVMRSGTAAKPRTEKIRTQRMSVDELDVRRLDEGSKADRERRMVTP
jgi:hypothetical protein